MVAPLSENRSFPFYFQAEIYCSDEMRIEERFERSDLAIRSFSGGGWKGES